MKCPAILQAFVLKIHEEYLGNPRKINIIGAAGQFKQSLVIQKFGPKAHI